MAGYSGTLLIRKLGIKEDARILLLNEPPRYLEYLGNLPRGATIHKELDGEFEFIHFFTESRRELETMFNDLKSSLMPQGMLWTSWPKGSYLRERDKVKVETQLNENIVRDIGLKNGMVDVKVCAIDDKWSGLKFVIRVKDRTSSRTE